MKFTKLFVLLGLIGIILSSTPLVQAQNAKQTADCTVAIIEQPTQKEVWRQTALADTKVMQYQRAFQTEQYSFLEDSVAINSMKCNRGLAKVVIIPLGKNGKDGWIGHVAFWVGEWDGATIKGAIADVSGETFAVAANHLTKELGDLETLQAPLNQIIAPAPSFAPDEEVIEEPPTAADGQSGYCRAVDAAHVAYTLIGQIAYKFRQRKYWCYDNVRVFNASSSAYIANAQASFFYRGVVSQWNTWGPSKTYHESYRQGLVENCTLVVGCWAAFYPWVRIKGTKTGSYTWSHGE